MENKTKLILSEQELEVVSDTGWILTKHKIIEKVVEFFSQQVPVIDNVIAQANNEFPHPLLATVPKISKGENYKKLPYVILDYPAVFSKENILAIRTMFWWGHFFSVTLHLSGEYKKMFEHNILKHGLQSDDGFFVCINQSQWEHHFEGTNYLPINQIEEIQINAFIDQKDFLKIAVQFDVRQWDDMDLLLKKSYQKIIYLLKY